jgi:hypothetical protein
LNQIGTSHAAIGAWRPGEALPKKLSPQSTVHDYFKLFDWDGTLECIHHALYIAVREQAGREASPSAAIIDSPSAKTAQKGGPRWTRKVTMRARRSQSPSHYHCFVQCAQSTGHAEPSPSAVAAWNVVGFCHGV